MNMPVAKTGVVAGVPSAPPAPAAAKVLPLTPKRPALASRILTSMGGLAASVVPPVVVIAFVLLLWEFLCRKAGATLPPPSRIIRDAWDLIAHPFYDRGGLDKGLFWHLSARLHPVALCHVLVALVGVASGTLVVQSVSSTCG